MSYCLIGLLPVAAHLHKNSLHRVTMLSPEAFLTVIASTPLVAIDLIIENKATVHENTRAYFANTGR